MLEIARCCSKKKRGWWYFFFLAVRFGVRNFDVRFEGSLVNGQTTTHNSDFLACLIQMQRQMESSHGIRTSAAPKSHAQRSARGLPEAWQRQPVTFVTGGTTRNSRELGGRDKEQDICCVARLLFIFISGGIVKWSGHSRASCTERGGGSSVADVSLWACRLAEHFAGFIHTLTLVSNVRQLRLLKV